MFELTEDKAFYRASEVARLFGVNQATVTCWMNRREDRLKAFKTGHVIRIARIDLQDFINRHYDRDEPAFTKPKKRREKAIDRAIAEIRRQRVEESLKGHGVIKDDKQRKRA